MIKKRIQVIEEYNLATSNIVALVKINESIMDCYSSRLTSREDMKSLASDEMAAKASSSKS